MCPEHGGAPALRRETSWGSRTMARFVPDATLRPSYRMMCMYPGPSAQSPGQVLPLKKQDVADLDQTVTNARSSWRRACTKLLCIFKASCGCHSIQVQVVDQSGSSRASKRTNQICPDLTAVCRPPNTLAGVDPTFLTPEPVLFASPRRIRLPQTQRLLKLCNTPVVATMAHGVHSSHSTLEHQSGRLDSC